jgi:murein DD-endopeptidase MepM/ murein hydrolase activator NlpD
MPHRVARLARWFPIACLMAAAPATATQNDPPPARVSADPATKVSAQIVAPTATTPVPTEAVRVLVAERGDTLTQLLAGAGIEAADAHPVISALTPLFPPRRLQPGQELIVRQDPSRDDALLALVVEPQPGRTVTVSRTATGWQAVEEEAMHHRHLVLASGEVSSSLFDELTAAGLPPALGLGLVRMLAHEIDFERELQPGDGFTVLFERFRDADGGLLRDGEVLHAEIRLTNRRLSLWRQETGAGAEWFDETGRSLRRNFLRTPLDGARVTSGFGKRRHPVLGFTRMHQGIDFAAPTGTPILAAADGVVERIGWAGGYGRLIALRHIDGTETRYAHLSAFARGLKRGGRVAQGEVIGRVGSSGASTGPHLHYEILEAGKQVDPANSRPAATIQLAGTELQEFHATRQAMLAQLAQLEPMQEVAWAD